MGAKRVMVFGVFDGCDAGHRFFLREAKKLGDELVVVVTRDDSAEALKKKCPVNSLEERINAIKELGIASEVVAGDKEQYSWSVFKKYNPDLVTVGYDQNELREAIKKTFDVDIFTISEYKER